MPEPDKDPADDYVRRLGQESSVRKEGWKRTLDDMEAIAEERREGGWTVLALPAVHTDAVSPDAGDDPDRWGFVHVLADNHAEELRSFLGDVALDRFEAYRSESGKRVFLVVELIDDDADAALLVACTYDATDAAGTIETAHERGVLHTHLKTVDGTPLGSIRHERVDPLVPDDR